jgi:hypothetical protein
MLLTDRETLDGELHSLGFVFVRQTVAELQGDLSIDSEPGKGTTITTRFPYLPGKTVTRKSPSSHEEYGQVPVTESTPTQPETAVTPAPPESSSAAPADGVDSAPKGRGERPFGKMVFDDYQASVAQFPGAIFAIAVTEDDRVDCFTHKPYERHWNITHEDLSPMLFQATVRGRLEEDDQKAPVLILKPPQSLAEYFELKELAQSDRSADTFLQMVHDECIRVARKLIATGLSPGIGLHLADAQRYFSDHDELLRDAPIPLELLASQALISEK